MKRIVFLVGVVISLLFVNLLLAEEKPKQMTDEEIKSNLMHLRETLSGPNTASSQMFTLSAINALGKEGEAKRSINKF